MPSAEYYHIVLWRTDSGTGIALQNSQRIRSTVGHNRCYLEYKTLTAKYVWERLPYWS